MRISDWSSDVCSSDLESGRDSPGHRGMPKGHPQSGAGNRFGFWGVELRFMLFALAAAAVAVPANAKEIQYVRSLDIAVSGAISQHCAMGSVGDLDFGNLDCRGFGIAARVAFVCNETGSAFGWERLSPDVYFPLD